MARLKKGAIEVQFNWLFVLIIGAILLFFVFRVIRGQMETTGFEVDTTIKTRLDTVLQQAAQTPGTLFTVQLRGAKFTSSDSCADSFYLNDNRNLRIELEAAFSPKEMDSVQGTFSLWVLPWEMPFRITNFVYLTSPDIIYLLVYDDNSYFHKDRAKELNFSRRSLSLPESLLKIVVSKNNLPGQLNNLNHLNTRVIYINETCNNPPFPSGANSAICIEVKDGPDYGGLDGWGKILYLSEDGNHKETYFLGRPSLIGAIFSEDHTQYTCSMQKAFRRMNHLLNIYHYRSKNLSVSDWNFECRGSHAEAKHKIDDLKDCLSNNPIPIPREKCIYENNFVGHLSLSSRNRETKLRSCVYVY